MSPPSSFVYTLLSVVIGASMIMRWLAGKNQFPVDGKTIVVTGGSQGMGLAVAKGLSQRGANVVIVAQSIPKLQNALKDIASCAANPQAQRFHFISADLRDARECQRVIAETRTWNQNFPPDSVFLCAGNSVPGYFIDTSPDALRAQMDSIYWCSANMAHATLSLWLSPVDGKPAPGNPLATRHIIFTSSLLAFFPLAGYSPYNPAKAALRSLSDTLTQELEYFNGIRHHSSGDASLPEVKVHTVFPAGIKSPGFEIENQLKPHLTNVYEESDLPQEPEEVAETTITALERGDYMITMNWLGHVIKGAAVGTSPLNGWGVVDALWSIAGWLVFRYTSWEFRKKAFSVGKKDGREVKGVAVSPYSKKP